MNTTSRARSVWFGGSPAPSSRIQAGLVCAVVCALVSFGQVARTEVTGPEPPERIPAQEAMPGLTYGQTDELPVPKTIFFGAGLDDIINDFEEWSKLGIQAFFVDNIAREWSTDIWARDGKPWTIGSSDETLQKARQASAICRANGTETFIKIAFDNHFEWFNDIAWQQANNNFRQFAIFAREAEFDGIALDIEYVGEQYDFNWEGYDYDAYTRKDLVAKIRERMTTVLGILYDEFPDMVFLTFPEQRLGLGSHIHTAWIEEAARRKAPGGIHYCTESTYRSPNINTMFAQIWLNNDIIQRLLSTRARRYWMDKCTISAGLWPFSSDDYRLYGPGMPYAEVQQGLAATLMTSPRYNWIYGSYTQRQLIGQDLDKYTEGEDIEAHLRMLARKEIVTDAKYVRLAQELRQKKIRDYSADLGLSFAPCLQGPNDTVRVDLLPRDALSRFESPLSWDTAIALYNGEKIDLRALLGTQTHWMMIGPFPNEGVEFSGHTAVYPPEESIDLAGTYDGLGGAVRWIEHQARGSLASVDLAKVFQPTERVCAYALCYVTSRREMNVQVRLGSNDAAKLWVGGEQVLDYPYEGSAILDREVVPVTLPKGTTPILLKVCNGVMKWAFIFRITDEEGRPVQDLEFSVTPSP
jgi:hypothetical protein